MLPSEAENSDIVTMTDSIATEILEKQIRGQITTIIYVDEGIYEQINSKKDERYFWTNQFRNINCTSTISGDFSFYESKIRKGGAWHLEDDIYKKRILNDN